MTRRSALLLPLLALLASCVPGPEYVTPSLPDGEGWLESAAADSEPPADWWRRFDDPVLDRLVRSALADNLDLALAGERIVEARSMRDHAAGGRRPPADARASVARRRQSETGLPPAGRIPGFPTYQTLYDAGLDAGWELDLFGRVDRRVEASQARLEATEEARRDAAVALVAEVARTYFETLGTRAELAARVEAVAAAEDLAALARRRHQAGGESELAVRRAEARLALARTQVPPLRARQGALHAALAVLAASDPAAVVTLLDEAPGLPDLDRVPVGTPAALLRRRSDVRRAERELAAATADVGVARGALYPSLRLAGSGGFTALGAGNWLDGASRTWSIAPVMSWRLLDGGRVQAEIRVAESRARQAALAYERSVLTALADTEQAVTGYHQALASVEALAQGVESAAGLHRLVARQQDAGLVSAVDRQQAALAEFEARAALARGRVGAATTLTRLYKSLGGGWQLLEAASR